MRAAVVVAAVLDSLGSGVGAVQYYTNPVSNQNSPDPGVLALGGSEGFLVTTTNQNASGAFSVFSTTDMVTYEPQGLLFPADNLPSWAIPPTLSNSNFWAPEVHLFRAGLYLAVYTARATNYSVLSIGVATAPTPRGPWTHQPAPLITSPLGSMGYIDATFFRDPVTTTPYVIWKSDGNAIGQPTPIHIAQLDNSTGTSVISNWTTLITNDLSWEGPLIEAPWMVYFSSYYFLFYSGNYGVDYAVGVARSSSPLGPFVKFGNPILHTANPSVAPVGPGHCSVLNLPDGNTAIWYHVWEDVNATFSYPRFLSQDRLWWNATGPLSGPWPWAANSEPSFTPTPVP
jgi:arabinan endo-1,5-alpha-L-arabinosidase